MFTSSDKILPCFQAVLWSQYIHFAILFFASVIFFLTVSIFIIVINKKVAVKKYRSFAARLEEWIMDVILDAEANAVIAVPDAMQKLLKNFSAKKVLLKEMIEVKKSLSGASGNNLEKLYNQLGLDEISLQRIADKKWHIKAKGIQELAFMNQHNQHSRIYNNTNHADLMVRMEAQTAMVRLQGFKALNFFETLSYPLSEWHQINLLQLLASQTIIEEHGMINWLHSDNSSVVQFCLKLIAEQHAGEFYDEVVLCLAHKDCVVRMEAILCLAQMPSVATAIELQNHYTIETDKNIRCTIIHQFQKIGSSEDLSFLHALQHDEDADIKLAANKTVLYLEKNFKPLLSAAS